MEHSCPFLLFSALYYVERRGNFYTIRVFFLKRKTLFSIYSYLINFLLSSQKIYMGSYPKSPATCSSYNLRNMAEYKDRCQVIIFLFWTLLQLGYYLVIEGERIHQHQHCGMQVGDFATTWRTTFGQ